MVIDDIKFCRSLKHVMCADSLRFFGDRLERLADVMSSVRGSLPTLVAFGESGDELEIWVRQALAFVDSAVRRLATTCLDVFRIYDFVAIGTRDYETRTAFMKDYASKMKRIVVRAGVVLFKLNKAFVQDQAAPLSVIAEEPSDKNTPELHKPGWERTVRTRFTRARELEETPELEAAKSEVAGIPEIGVAVSESPNVLGSDSEGPVQAAGIREILGSNSTENFQNVKPSVVLTQLLEKSWEIMHKLDEMQSLCDVTADEATTRIMRGHLAIIRSSITDLRPDISVMHQVCAQASRLESQAEAE